ncbi:ketoacyl-ACP synthase III [Streptomyces catenulae]|uniref:Ketoacyl-ACP synthase III n=1 Tax=Streptomyces catenulae TaxID=66875 RepID=A0ABV2YZK9_9ACTN|nr:ketoacyl-ACP synthase III [Streptomyces catenulae]
MVSTGSYRPASVDAGQVAERLGVTREWVLSRTGVESRCVAGPDESVMSMATLAAREALAAAELPADAVDVVLVATSSNLQLCPAVAPQVAAALGLQVAAFDLSVACAGFCYALHVARSLIGAGGCDTVLVIGADRMLDMIDPDDPVTAPLFADGAGAVVLRATEGESGVGPVVWGSCGQRSAALEVRPHPLELEIAARVHPRLHMDGLAVTRWACATVPAAVREILAAGGIGWDDVAAFIPHQANWKMIRRVVRALDVPDSVVVADDGRFTGNTSAASVPLALDRLVTSGGIPRGRWAVLVGYGAGLAYAGQAVRIP